MIRVERLRWRVAVEEVALVFDRETYERLLACLTSHSSNEVVNGRVVNCLVAAHLLADLQMAIGDKAQGEDP